MGPPGRPSTGHLYAPLGGRAMWNPAGGGGDVGAEEGAPEWAEAGVPEWMSVEIAQSLRVLRASRGLSQRGLAEATGVSKSAIARLEAGTLPPGVARWLRTISDLGLVVTARPELYGADVVAPPPHRDAAGRHFPAHVVARWQSMPPTWWFVRNGGWGTKVAEPEWFWHRRS